jgi:hypothetical protein
MKINLHRVIREYNTIGDRQVTLTAAIPLKLDPVQIGLSGDIDDEAEMRSVLRQLGDSLEGEASIYSFTPWLMYCAIALFIGWVVRVARRKTI